MATAAAYVVKPWVVGDASADKVAVHPAVTLPKLQEQQQPGSLASALQVKKEVVLPDTAGASTVQNFRVPYSYCKLCHPIPQTDSWDLFMPMQWASVKTVGTCWSG